MKAPKEEILAALKDGTAVFKILTHCDHAFDIDKENGNRLIWTDRKGDEGCWCGYFIQINDKLVYGHDDVAWTDYDEEIEDTLDKLGCEKAHGSAVDYRMRFGEEPWCEAPTVEQAKAFLQRYGYKYFLLDPKNGYCDEWTLYISEKDNSDNKNSMYVETSFDDAARRIAVSLTRFSQYYAKTEVIIVE